MRTKVASIFLLLLSVTGCTPLSLNGQPVFSPKFFSVKKIVILPPRIEVSEIGAGGVIEKIDDWSQTGAANITAAVAAELKTRRGIEVRNLPLVSLPDNLKAELEETQSLFDAVNGSVLLHIYGPPPYRFDEKLVQFNYSLGNETAKLRVDDSDAFLLIKGFDQISSAGRMALQTTAMLAAAALGVVIIPQMGATLMNAALVDARTGDILWYNFDRADGAYDLRDPVSATSFVRKLLAKFP